MTEKCLICDSVSEILIPIKWRRTYGFTDEGICPACLVAQSGIRIQSEVRLQ